MPIKREVTKIIAVSLLAKSNLAALGSNFDRAFPVPASGSFEDLLLAIDEAQEALPLT